VLSCISCIIGNTISDQEKNNNTENLDNVKRQYKNYNQSQLREFEDPKGIIKNRKSKKDR